MSIWSWFLVWELSTCRGHSQKKKPQQKKQQEELWVLFVILPLSFKVLLICKLGFPCSQGCCKAQMRSWVSKLLNHEMVKCKYGVWYKSFHYESNGAVLIWLTNFWWCFCIFRFQIFFLSISVKKIKDSLPLQDLILNSRRVLIVSGSGHLRNTSGYNGNIFMCALRTQFLLDASKRIFMVDILFNFLLLEWHILVLNRT